MMSLVNEGEEIRAYALSDEITNVGAIKHYYISDKDSDDMLNAVEDTLHRLIDSGMSLEDARDELGLSEDTGDYNFLSVDLGVGFRDAETIMPFVDVPIVKADNIFVPKGELVVDEINCDIVVPLTLTEDFKTVFFGEFKDEYDELEEKDLISSEICCLYDLRKGWNYYVFDFQYDVMNENKFEVLHSDLYEFLTELEEGECNALNNIDRNLLELLEAKADTFAKEKIGMTLDDYREEWLHKERFGDIPLFTLRKDGVDYEFGYHKLADDMICDMETEDRYINTHIDIARAMKIYQRAEKGIGGFEIRCPMDKEGKEQMDDARQHNYRSWASLERDFFRDRDVSFINELESISLEEGKEIEEEEIDR